LAYPPSRYEIIVVDNAPQTSATAEFINQCYGGSSQIRYVCESRPGVSHARNRGLAVAQGDVVAFVDDDELVDEHWLAGLVGGFAAAERVACVTGLIVPSEIETPAQGWFEQFGGYCKGGCTRHIFNLTDRRPPEPLFPYNVGMLGSGGSMAFRRSILRDMGGFDPALGSATPALGGEDIEALLRVLLAGHTLVYEPAAILYHPPHRDFACLRRQIHSYGTGLTACLFKTALAHPRLLPDFMAKLPPAVRYALSSRSPHHAHKQSDYPRELSWLELRGMVYGPLAYLRSAIKIRSERRDALE
jgi:glycosyltransferase involved in cell wall biosynthesis